jgi:hypothetical protein
MRNADELEAAATLSALAGFCQQLAVREGLALDKAKAAKRQEHELPSTSEPVQHQPTKRRKRAVAAAGGGGGGGGSAGAATQGAGAGEGGGALARQEGRRASGAAPALASAATSSCAGVKMQDVFHLLHLSHLSEAPAGKVV